MVYTQALLYGYGASELKHILKKSEQHYRAEEQSIKKEMSCSSLERERSSPVEEEEEGEEEEEKMVMEEEELARLQRDVAQRLERSLAQAKEAPLRCRALLLPARMTARVAGDILRAAAHEPCGLRGALIHLYMEERSGGLQTLGTVTPERSVTPTFELSVIFSRDPAPSLKRLFGTETVLRLRPAYRMIKKKLYSSASPTVLEFY